MSGKGNEAAERALGMEQSITRRDFLGATLLASGGQLLEPLTPAHFLARQTTPLCRVARKSGTATAAWANTQTAMEIRGKC